MKDADTPSAPESRASLGTMIREVDRLFHVHRGVLAGLIALGLLVSLLEGIGISLFIPLLHSLSPESSGETGGRFVSRLLSWTSEIDPGRRLPIIVVLILAAVTLRTLLSFAYGAANGYITSQEGHRLRSKLFHRIQSADYGFLEQTPYGRLLNGLATESWRATDALNTAFHLFIGICTAAIYVALLLVLSWELTLVVAAGMLVISWTARRAARRVEALGREATHVNTLLAQRISDGLAGVKQIRIFGRESFEIERFRRISSTVAGTFWRLGVLAGIVSPIFEILSAVLIGGVLLLQFGTAEDLPALLVFLFVLYRLKPRIEQIDSTRVKLSSLYAAVEEMRHLLDAPPAPQNLDGEPLPVLRDDVAFASVSFRYPGQESQALMDVSFTIPSGSTTAIVGPSGAGKSTILKLLLRLYDPNSGAIRVGDSPLTEIKLDDWRARLGMVSQEAYLFDATIAENIEYGREGASREEIIHAAMLAHAHSFIQRLPRGYDTRVHERGVRLSGGQQQRIVLARALIRNPDLLILDEATNNLDTLSERLVQDALEAFSGNRTVVIVAHRLSTIERADHIIVLDEGRMVEEGSFGNLLDKKGLFSALYEAQSDLVPGRGAYVSEK